MKCPACGYENREGASFCGECGAGLAERVACAACGTENRGGARFCDSCGRPLPEAAPRPTPRSVTPPHLAEKMLRARGSIEGERRTVTILFADAVGSTAMAERVDEEQVYRLMQGCLARMTEAVHRYEGHVAQFTGDGVMAIFGAPIAHEDSARRAVAAALDMQRSLDEYAQQARQELAVSCRFRVGLHTGPVVVGSISDDLAMDFTALGDTANLAARMEQSAEPGTVYLTEATHRAIADFFACEPLGALLVKGKSEPVPAFRAVREKPARTRFDVAAERGLTPFVGRDEEVEVLGGYFGKATRGQGQVVGLSGEAGIGKSRLLLEFRRSLGPGVRWLEGHCISYGRNAAYLPIADVVRRSFGVGEADSEEVIIRRVEEGTAEWDDAARAAVPYLRFVLSVDPGDERVAVMDPRERRAGIFDALRTLLAREGAAGPLVLVVEDLHWVDEKSDEALAALVDVVETAPLLLLLTHRPGYQPSFVDRSFFSRIALRHLAEGESARMAAAVLQVAEVPDELRRLIAGKAEGNPFFVEEVTKSLLESGVLRRRNGSLLLERPPEEVVIPDTIQEVILSRIDRLEREAREAIQLASVIGREFTVRLLERISSVEGQLDDVLGELKSLELIYEKAFFPELAYMFKHALTHDVAYSTLLLERRKALHRLVATATEELYADRLAEHYEALAHHYTEGEVWEKGLDYLIKAGEKAAAAYANRDALDFYGRALEVGERIGADVEILRGTAMNRGFVQLGVGDVVAGQGDFDHAARLARRAGSLASEANALVFRGGCELFEHSFERADATFREALAKAEQSGDPKAVFAACVWFVDMLLIVNRHAEAEPLIARARQMESRVEDAATRSLWGGIIIILENWRGRYGTALATWQAAIEAGANPPDALTRMLREWTAGLALAGAGRYSEALDHLRRTLEECDRIEEVQSRARIINTIGWIYGELQDFGGAIEWNQRGLDAARAIEVPDPEIEANARLNLGDALVGLGRLEEAEEHYQWVDELVRSPRPEDEWMRWRYSQHLFHSYGNLWMERGDAQRALALADACLTLAGQSDSRKNIVKGRRLRGRAMLADGRAEDAEREIEAALELARDLANPPQLWKTLAALGDLRRAQGRTADARSAYGEALEVVELVGKRLTEVELRDTFLSSEHVAGIRRAAESVAGG